MPHFGEKQKEEGEGQKKSKGGNKAQQRDQGYEVKYTAILGELCPTHVRFKSSLKEKALATYLKDHPWQGLMIPVSRYKYL